MKNQQTQKNSSNSSKERIITLELSKSLKLFERVEKLKNTIRLKRRKEKREKELEILKLKGIKYVKDNIANINFHPNPFNFKKEVGNFNFIKHKKAIDFATRNIHHSKIEDLLRKEALHFVEPKSKVVIKNEDQFEEVKLKIQKSKMKFNNLSKSFKKTLSSYSKSPSYVSIRNNSVENPSRVHMKRNSVIKGSNYNHYLFLQTFNDNYNPINKKFNSANMTIGSSSSKKNFVQHSPIYTTNINELLHDYKRLKNRLYSEKKSNANIINIYVISRI